MNRIKIAKKLGLTIKVHKHDRAWNLYDGKVAHVSSAVPDIDIDHEIGHFLAATARERTRPEWGLGRGPEYPHEEILQEFGLPDLVKRHSWDTRNKAEDDRAEAREGAASLFGIAVTYVFGPKDAWRKHATSHTWDRGGVACDLFCLIADTDKYYLKNRLTKVLAQLTQLKGRR
jgi:hypothetical protein